MIRLPGKARGHWDGAGIRGFGCKSSFFVCGGGDKERSCRGCCLSAQTTERPRSFPRKQPNNRTIAVVWAKTHVRPRNARTLECSRAFPREEVFLHVAPSASVLQLHEVLAAAVRQDAAAVVGGFGHVAQHVYGLFLVGHVGLLDQAGERLPGKCFYCCHAYIIFKIGIGRIFRLCGP